MMRGGAKARPRNADGSASVREGRGPSIAMPIPCRPPGVPANHGRKDPIIPHYRIPRHAAGLRIGLFGGTFDPPHQAHLAACLLALKRLRLDRVWWLVTPGNPLKDGGSLHDLDERAEAARQMARDPRIDVSCLESVIGTRYTVDTVRYLRRRASGLRFVWIMGADNLAQFHRWQNWRRIASEVPIAVIDRPPQSFRALASPAAQALARYRLPENQAGRLAEQRTPAWVFLTGMKMSLSSTGLRNLDGSWRTK